MVYFQVVRIPRKGSSAILQSMSISSSPLLFIVCSFLAIVSALTAATFLRTIQLLGGFTAQNNNGKKLENIKDRKVYGAIGLLKAEFRDNSVVEKSLSAAVDISGQSSVLTTGH